VRRNRAWSPEARTEAADSAAGVDAPAAWRLWMAGHVPWMADACSHANRCADHGGVYLMVFAAPAARMRRARRRPIGSTPMQNLFIGLAAAASLFAASPGWAQRADAAHLVFGVDRAGDRPGLTPAQFVYANRQYCWYPNGWKGPGFYWCGYAMRRGYGWGGPAGWMGYSYRGGSYYHGGAVYHGGVYRGGTVSSGQNYVRGPNGGVAHGGHVNGAYGGSARGGAAYGPHGGAARGGAVNGPNGGRAAAGAVTGPGGHSASGARVTGPHGESRTVVRGH
jgi:hypothetical protein